MSDHDLGDATEATASLNTKIDPEEERLFIENTAALGMIPSAAIKEFVRMFNACKGLPFAVRSVPAINYSSPSLSVAHMDNGRVVVPSSWRDEDDE